MGERVEAKRTPDADFEPGQIVSIHKNTGLYDVAFERGEASGVSPAYIRKAYNINRSKSDDKDEKRSEGSNPIELPEESYYHFQVGEQVEALRENSNNTWRLGIIANVNHAIRTVDVIFSDRYRQNAMPLETVRALWPNEAIINEDFVATINPSQPPPVSTQLPPSVLYKVGMKIEARYHGGRLYYSGKILQVYAEHSVADIVYDDGDMEQNVPFEFIKTIDDLEQSIVINTIPNHPITTATTIAPTVEPDYPIGLHIEGNYQGQGKWYPGKISNHRWVSHSKEYRYGIEYKDGDYEENVPSNMIRFPKFQTTNHLTATAATTAATTATATATSSRQRQGQGSMTAQPQESIASNTFTSPLRKGRVMKSTPSNPITANATPPREATINIHNATNPRSTPAGDGIQTQQQQQHQQAKEEEEEESELLKVRIEGNYLGKGKWYPGKILQEKGQDTADLLYDDGEVEYDVPVSRIRLLEEKKVSSSTTITNNRPPAASSGADMAVTVGKKYKLGEDIEGNYRMKGRYYPGKIAAMVFNTEDGTVYVDILYADGDEEVNVSIDRIRPRGDNSPNTNSASTTTSGGGGKEESIRQSEQIIKSIPAQTSSSLSPSSSGSSNRPKSAHKQTTNTPPISINNSNNSKNSVYGNSNSNSDSSSNRVNAPFTDADIQALKALLQEKDAEITHLQKRLQKTSQQDAATTTASTADRVPTTSSAVSANAMITLQEEMEGIKQQYQQTQTQLLFLGEQFTLIIQEMMTMKQQEQQLLQQVTTQKQEIKRLTLMSYNNNKK